MKAALEKYFDNVVKDMAAQNPKVPVSAFRTDVDNISAKLYAPDWFQYMIFGRGPGKQPPPSKMLSWVQKNPDIFSSARTKFKYITEKGLAFLVGRKIGREGTDVYQGKKKGVDLLGAMEKYMPELKKEIAKEVKLDIVTSLKSKINGD